MLSGVSGREGARHVQLRRLTVDDWALWREVRLRALADAPQAFDATLADWQGEGDVEDRWRARLVEVPFNVVGTIDGVAIGQVSGTALDDRGRCELISMWVDASVRGRGVGGALIDGVASWARSMDASALVLSVRQSNAHAVDLYTRASFVPIDEPAGDRCDLRMRRDIG
jgi:ribosomal protein S18 acetylase RimI-like enzyme